MGTPLHQKPPIKSLRETAVSLFCFPSCFLEEKKKPFYQGFSFLPEVRSYRACLSDSHRPLLLFPRPTSFINCPSPSSIDPSAIIFGLFPPPLPFPICKKRAGGRVRGRAPPQWHKGRGEKKKSNLAKSQVNLPLSPPLSLSPLFSAPVMGNKRILCSENAF